MLLQIFLLAPTNCPPPPKMVSNCANGLWLYAISKQALSNDCYCQWFHAGFFMKLQKNSCITSGLLNHSLSRCSKICSQDECATGTAKTMLPPPKDSFALHLPPPFISSWRRHCLPKSPNLTRHLVS